jgi:YedE family putative selenium metabolism protein
MGLALVLFVAVLLFLRLAFPPVAGESKSAWLFYSQQGPGSLHAPAWASIVIALLIGIVGQRSRFCSIGAIQDLILFGRGHLLFGVFGFIGAAFIANLIFGQFHPGFSGQPIAHTLYFWNFWGLLVVGFGSALVGGCPGRQLFLAGEGDGDAGVYVLGLLAGLAMAHNWGFASSPAGIGPHGALAGFLSAFIVLLIGVVGLRQAPPRPRNSLARSS